MFSGQGSATSRFVKWPAVAVVAVASSFYTMDYTKTWWNNFADRFGLTLNALDSSDLSSNDGSRPWWKRVLSKYQKQEEPSIPPDVLSEILSKNQFTKNIQNGIVAKLETNQISANLPIEDRNIECVFPNTDSFFFGVFDGHSGYHCSQALKDRMPQYLSLAMSKLHNKPVEVEYSNSTQKMYEVVGKDDYDLPLVTMPPDLEKRQSQLGTGIKHFSKLLMSKECKIKTHEELIKLAFVTLDKDICTEAIPDKFADETLMTGLSGSCAIASCVDGDDLYVANTGKLFIFS